MTHRHPTPGYLKVVAASAVTCVLACLLACPLASCGGARGSEGDRAAAPPPTDRDPPPFSPSPVSAARTGEVVGLVTSGGLEQARAVTIRFIAAVRDEDRDTLEQILADPMGRVRPQLRTPWMPRATVMQQLLHPQRRRLSVGSDTPVDRLVDTDGIEVIPLAQRDDEDPVPEGYSGTDLLVKVPVQEGGRQLLGLTLRWTGDGFLVVRPGPEPRVVAL